MTLSNQWPPWQYYLLLVFPGRFDVRRTNERLEDLAVSLRDLPERRFGVCIEFAVDGNVEADGLEANWGLALRGRVVLRVLRNRPDGSIGGVIGAT